MLAGALAAVLALTAPAQAKPPTIPALREWRGEAGAFQVAASTRVVGTGPDAALLARELRRPAVAGAEPQPGDVVLALGSPDRRLGREGYRLDVGTTLRIEARTTAGLFYGAQSALQLLRGGHGTIPAGHVRDWPRYPERGLMLDCGRRYYSPAWIKARIRELAALKLNQLHLHFSDNQGFRIESTGHPEAVTRPYLTKLQVRDLIAYARRRHVRVIPELDMPGHMQAALRAHPELQVAGRPDQLDFTKPAARRFARELILEYLDLFDGRWWHAGADEFSGPGDFVGFVNWIDRLVRRHGRTLRVWHDGQTRPGLRRDVVVEWWAEHAGPSPAELLARGHRILNAGWWPTYYVNSPLGAIRPSMRAAYESWRVNAFGGLSIGSPLPNNPPQVVRRHRDRVLGAELHVWNDDPSFETVTETARGIAPRLRVIAQKTWDTPPPARTYAGFERLWRLIRPTGRPPSSRP
jgi:hexosaminidase